MTPNTVENFYPIYKENRETSVYFKDESGEAIVVEINSPEFDTLNARYEAYKESNATPAEEVAETPVTTEPTTAPVEENTPVAEVVTPESTETANEEVTAPENAVSDEVAPTETADATVGVDLAADGTESETVSNEVVAEEVANDQAVEENTSNEVNDAPQN